MLKPVDTDSWLSRMWNGSDSGGKERQGMIGSAISTCPTHSQPTADQQDTPTESKSIYTQPNSRGSFVPNSILPNAFRGWLNQWLVSWRVGLTARVIRHCASPVSVSIWRRVASVDQRVFLKSRGWQGRAMRILEVWINVCIRSEGR